MSNEYSIKAKKTHNQMIYNQTILQALQKDNRKQCGICLEKAF